MFQNQRRPYHTVNLLQEVLERDKLTTTQKETCLSPGRQNSRKHANTKNGIPRNTNKRVSACECLVQQPPPESRLIKKNPTMDSKVKQAHNLNLTLCPTRQSNNPKSYWTTIFSNICRSMPCSGYIRHYDILCKTNIQKTSSNRIQL